MQFDTVTIKVTDGIKQGDYAPNKVYELTGFLTNADEDRISAGVDVLRRAGERYLKNAPQVAVITDKPPEGEFVPSQPTSDASPASPAEPSPTPAEEPKRRVRRTREQIAADEAAAAAAKAGQAAPATSEPTPPATASPTPASTASDDNEWEAAAPQAVTIPDTELNHSCSVTAERVKDPAKVKAVIAKFNPGGDAWDPAKPGGRKFTVNDIPQQQRADFLAQLKAVV